MNLYRIYFVDAKPECIAVLVKDFDAALAAANQYASLHNGVIATISHIDKITLVHVETELEKIERHREDEKHDAEVDALCETRKDELNDD